MTKMQIIAKAALTFIGLYAINSIFNFIGPWQFRPEPDLIHMITGLSLLSIIIAIAHLSIFKNDRFARKMAGSGEILNPNEQILWLTASLRIVAILFGLILISYSGPTIVNILLIPFRMRDFIQQTFIYKQPLDINSAQGFMIIYNLLKLAAAAYLILGWPHFINYQLKFASRIDYKYTRSRK